MAARALACTLLATLLGSPGTQAPRTTRFRVDQTLSQEIDATGAGKGKQRLSFSTTSWLSVTLTDTAGGRSVRVVVDSMRGDSTSPIPPTVFDSAKGAEFHAFLAHNGRLSDLEGVNVSPAAARVQGFLSDFFPWVKAGARTNEQWADTSSKITTDGHDSVVVKRITSYRVVGSEQRNATKALRVASQYSSAVHGTQPTPNGPAKLEGTGKGTGTYWVTQDGSYLGGDWQLESALTLTGSFADDPLPISISQTTKVTTLP
ncbi:MAG TPA: hypothetical protein VHR43_10955 [Gemmatimonadales bacterium]|jgi:hypothetical protein|nr:hypothetical protein [Gemmatimonadales bacterium]